MNNILTIILSVIFLPISIIASWITLSPQEEKIILYWGKFYEVLKSSGLNFRILWGRSSITVSTKLSSIDLRRTMVADGNGNPILIAGVCTFQVVDTAKAALEVEHYIEYIKTQAMAVLKQVASKYPYESNNGHSLKGEAKEIGLEMVRLLQSKVIQAGINVISFELSDLSYAPEIAQSMLVRQQAQALVDARKIIVDGAVSIAADTVKHLGADGITFNEVEKQRLVSNLLVVICGESKVQPTYSTTGNDNTEVLAALGKFNESINALPAKIKNSG
jgi:regulator of protease activity HflC (stomatin/prohibitin superfamily)